MKEREIGIERANDEKKRLERSKSFQTSLSSRRAFEW